MRGDFRKTFFTEKGLLGQTLTTEKESCGKKCDGRGSRDLRMEARQVCLNRRERLETGVE